MIHKYQLNQSAQIQFDNGTEFTNNLLKTSLDKLGVTISYISPYNSRSAAVERAHRTLRSIIRNSTAIDKFHIETKIEMAIDTYNQQPQRGLDYRSPFSILYGIEPKNYLAYFQDIDNAIHKTDTITDESVSIWVNHLRLLHTERGVEALEQYTYKSDSKLIQYKEGDIVICFDPKINLSKVGTIASGPYKVIGRHLSSYTLSHCFTGIRIKRNHRFIRPLHLKEEVKAAVLENQFLINNKNELVPFKNFQFSHSPTVLKVGIEDEIEPNFKPTIPCQAKEEKRYKLRERKHISYKE